MMKKCLALLIGIFFFFTAQLAFAQGVAVGPDGQFSPQTLALPYAFYNENFGFAGGFVYGKVGALQKQANLLTTAIVGTKGGMGFLVGKDIQMPLIERLFLDPILSVGYLIVPLISTAIPIMRVNAPAATTPTKTTMSKATAGTTFPASDSNICCRSATAKMRSSPPIK
jgi:hypothetical protein